MLLIGNREDMNSQWDGRLLVRTHYSTWDPKPKPSFPLHSVRAVDTPGVRHSPTDRNRHGLRGPVNGD